MRKSIIAAAVAAALATPAAAAPVLWGGNGHYYEYVQTSADWAQARTAALGMSFMGQQGYLVTLTSAAENGFVAGLTNSLAWTGGNDLGTEGTWMWADGPEAGSIYWVGGPGGTAFGYTNWEGGEPNDFAPGEDAMHLNFSVNGGWNDYFATSTHGYIVEYGGLRNAVPEPAAWAMLIAGFAVVGGALRRSRRARPVLTYA